MSNQQLILGNWEEGGNCVIDLPRLLETKALIQAASGGGKSWMLRRLLEQSAGKVQQLVIDVEGEFSTLREKHDLVICAAQGGDALAHPKTAELLALRLLETGVSAVLDLYDLKVTKNADERAQFVDIFLRTIVNAPKRLWHPVLIVIDEIHMFSPEVGDSVSSSSVIDLATRGRKRGFCLVGATQRISKFNKDTAAELHNKLIGFTSLDIDLARASQDLGISKSDARDQLRIMQPGEFYAYGPAIRSVPSRMKSGPVFTTHPKPGQRKLVAPPKPTAAIKAILPQLADLPQEAEQEARTANELRTEVQRLKRELNKKVPAVAAKAPAQVVSTDIVKAAETRGYARGLKEGSQLLIKTLKEFGPRARASLDAALQECIDGAKSATPKESLPLPYVDRVMPSAVTGVTLSTSKVSEGGTLTSPEQRIVDAIAWLETATGIQECKQVAVAFIADYSYSASSFKNPRGSLNSKGLIEYLPDERIQLTDSGRQVAYWPLSPSNTADLHQRILLRLGDPERRILRPLLESYPKAMDGLEVANAANYSHDASSFKNPRGKLKSLGLIEYVSGKAEQLKAADFLFLDR